MKNGPYLRAPVTNKAHGAPWAAKYSSGILVASDPGKSFLFCIVSSI